MMEKNRKKSYGIMALVLVCCVFMAFVETVVEPAYAVKSGIKAVVFLGAPLIFAKAADLKLFDRSFTLDRKHILQLLALGALIYAVIFGGYTLTKSIFDYQTLVQALSSDQKVDGRSFVWVALYISLCNSFLEEFLFRFVSFLKLSQYTARTTAYAVSSILFAIYHVAMIGGSFPPVLLVLSVIGLAAGGCIFDYVDEKSGSIYPSWIIHMCADLALMTIWYLHI